jgi:hypothetical protein
MQETSTSPATILQFRQDIEAQFRRHIREALDTALAEELAAALGSEPHQRRRTARPSEWQHRADDHDAGGDPTRDGTARPDRGH